MCCYAGKLLQQPKMSNPTLVVVTDRNDLDGQLYQQFCAAKDLLKQTPEQAESREQLREMLTARQSGGIIFTTIQKFSLLEGETAHPPLCTRSNVVVIADEAHRSQYGMKGRLDQKSGYYVFGYAKHMRDALPNASFIGFTGTPISTRRQRHPRRLRRLRVDLRHPGRRGRQGDGADLLREPAGQAGHQPRGDRRAKQGRGGSDRGRGGRRRAGNCEEQMDAAREARRRNRGWRKWRRIS